jgi:hypothetical protein
MKIFCIVIVVFALFISVGAPYLAFLMCVIAFSILLFTKLDKKEEKALDFGQEWDYDSASQEYYRKQDETSKKHDAKMQRAAARLAAKNRPKVLSKIASGQQRVWVFTGFYGEDFTFRRFFTQYLQCGPITNVFPFFLEFKVKDFVM